MHSHARSHTHALFREVATGRFYFSDENHGRKGKTALRNTDWKISLRQKKYKHVDSRLVFIREKKKMEERDWKLERFLDALLPGNGDALAKMKNGKRE